MKKRRFHFIMFGILVLGVIISSCTKEKDLEFSDNLYQADNVLKSRDVNVGSLTPLQQLGRELFFDKISDPDRMACAECHGPQVGFTGPSPAINKKGAVYMGATPQRFGNRKPPSAAYATFSPILHEDGGVFAGGNFWDGRATGEHYSSNPDVYVLTMGLPAAEQALGPFLNPVEQNNASKADVLKQIAKSKYAYLWTEAWGEELTYDTEEISSNYDRVGLAIAAYEGSSEVNAFSSKYDYYLQYLQGQGSVELTNQEKQGLDLFNGDAMCSGCHISKPSLAGEPPLFTDFTFDNLGVPKNPDNPFYDEDEVFLPDGSAINPLGDAWIDLGLGGYLQTRPKYVKYAEENMGKQKVPTLRNVDKRPGIGFTKAYTHNGVFKSLKEVVHFYNTRDVEGAGWNGVPWPDPEVPATVKVSATVGEIGNLGLSDAQENEIVAFMKTLSDGYIIK